MEKLQRAFYIKALNYRINGRMQELIFFYFLGKWLFYFFEVVEVDYLTLSNSYCKTQESK